MSSSQMRAPIKAEFPYKIVQRGLSEQVKNVDSEMEQANSFGGYPRVNKLLKTLSKTKGN